MKDTPGCANDDVGHVGFQHLDVVLNRNASVENGRLHFRQVLLESLKNVANLERQFSSVAQN